jgi:hypothetical protein
MHPQNAPAAQTGSNEDPDHALNAKKSVYLGLLAQEAKEGAHVNQRLLRLPVHRPQEVEGHGHLRHNAVIMT